MMTMETKTSNIRPVIWQINATCVASDQFQHFVTCTCYHKIVCYLRMLCIYKVCSWTDYIINKVIIKYVEKYELSRYKVYLFHYL